MSKQHKTIKQEYIAKVRYTNDLPPPPLNPKLLQYNTTEPKDVKTENEELLSSLFRKENFQSFIAQVDEEYGLNLNLINNSGFLDKGDHSVIYSLKGVEALHPDDRVLLRDAGIGNISKSEPGVSFLRRTEYIAERLVSKSSAGSEKSHHKEESHDAELQLRAVEATFDEAQKTLEDLSQLKHPRKKNLKAVAAWPLLPDTAMMDSKFLNVKFAGSASINRELDALKRLEKEAYDATFQENRLASAIYKPITSEDGEWISVYQVSDASSAVSLREKLNSTKREQPINLLDEEENVDEFKFKLFKNYDMQYTRHAKANEELAIKFVPEGKKRKAAYYYPVLGRIVLKKNRASTNTEINRFLRESTYDGINFKLREPNTNELRAMDNARSEFDPMEYEGDEEEETTTAPTEATP